MSVRIKLELYPPWQPQSPYKLVEKVRAWHSKFLRLSCINTTVRREILKTMRERERERDCQCTMTATPVSQNLGIDMSLTDCLSGPERYK